MEVLLNLLRNHSGQFTMESLQESRRLLPKSSKKCSNHPYRLALLWILSKCHISHHLCLPSKAVILILFWSVIIVGTIYYSVIGLAVAITDSNEGLSISVYDSLTYAVPVFHARLIQDCTLVCARRSRIQFSMQDDQTSFKNRNRCSRFATLYLRLSLRFTDWHLQPKSSSTQLRSIQS